MAFTVSTTITTTTTPTLTTSKATYAPGENIVVNFANDSGNAKDWIGILRGGYQLILSSLGVYG